MHGIISLNEPPQPAPARKLRPGVAAFVLAAVATILFIGVDHQARATRLDPAMVFRGARPTATDTSTTVTIDPTAVVAMYFENMDSTDRICINVNQGAAVTCANTNADFTNQIVLEAGDNISLILYGTTTFKYRTVSGQTADLVWRVTAHSN